MSIHGKELGSISLRHWKKKYPDLASTRFRIHSVFKNFHSGVRIKKILQILLPDSPDTCGRKPYPQRKSCGFKNIRIRVDGAWGIVRRNPDICESTYFLHESSFHPHETSESALQSGFLSLVYTDPDFKMCGFKNDFKINRRSMYQKNA